MFKKALIVVLALAIAMVGMTGVFAESTKTTVTIWSTFTNDQDAYIRRMADEFNALQDEFVVVVETQPNSNFTSNVYTAVVNGVGPDIIFNYASEAAKYVNAGLVANLDEYIYDEEIGIEGFDDMLPEYLIEEMNAMEDGHIHWIPGATTGPILFYNKTMLEELNVPVPTTWDELVDACAVIKAAKPEVLPFGIDSLTDIIQTFIMEAGEGYIDTENAKIAFGGEKTVEVLKWYQEQCQNGYFSATAPSGGYFSNDFNTGLVAMYYGSCAGTPYITPDGFEYDVAPAPATAGGEGAYSIWNRGPIVFHYADNTAREVGAYLYVMYMLAVPANAEGWAEAMTALTPWIPAQAVEGYDAFVASQPALAAVAGNFDIGVTFPSVTGASETRDAIKQMGTLIAGGEAVETALAACLETANAALQGK